MESPKPPPQQGTGNKSLDGVTSGTAIDAMAGPEQFEGKTPLQIARMLVPNLKDELLAGLFFGFGLDLGIQLPDWAKRASGQFWKYFVGTSFDPLHSSQDAGVLVGLLESIAKQAPLGDTERHNVLLKKLSPVFFDVAMKEVQNLTAEEAAKFYSGRAKSARVVERVMDPNYLKMLKRAPIYLAVALLWEHFQTFKSQAEAERWLRTQKVISEDVDTREVRATFTVIGLRYRGPGRPKKSENGLSNSTESGFPKSIRS